METFDAPREGTDEIDFASVKPGILVVVAGVAQIVAGATMFAQGVQLWTMFVFYSWLWILPYLLVPLGLLQMALGATASLGRDWATIGGLIVTWLVQLVALAFVVWTILQGGILVLAYVWAFLNGIAALMAPMAVPGSLRASAARRKLYQ